MIVYEDGSVFSDSSSTTTESSSTVQQSVPVDLSTVEGAVIGVQYGMVVLDFLLACVLGCLLAKAINWFKW